MTNKKQISFSVVKPLSRYRNIYLNFIFVFFLVFLDQFLKNQFTDPALKTSNSFLGFSIAKAQNSDFVFGWSFGANPFLIQTILISIFLILFFYYAVLIFFAGKRFYTLQTACSFLFAGFTSNLLSKISEFYVLDYIKWSWKSIPLIYFNMADVFQLIGWILLVSQLILNYKIIWKREERRKSFLILKSYQYQFLAYCTAAFLLVSCFFIFFTRQFFLDPTGFYDLKSFGSMIFLMLFSLLFFIYFSIGVFFIYLSNKIYGPVFAFEKYIRNLLKGKEQGDFKLRSNDHFKSLQDLAKDIKKSLKK